MGCNGMISQVRATRTHAPTLRVRVHTQATRTYAYTWYDSDAYPNGVGNETSVQLKTRALLFLDVVAEALRCNAPVALSTNTAAGSSDHTLGPGPPQPRFTSQLLPNACTVRGWGLCGDLYSHTLSFTAAADDVVVVEPTKKIKSATDS